MSGKPQTLSERIRALAIPDDFTDEEATGYWQATHDAAALADAAATTPVVGAEQTVLVEGPESLASLCLHLRRMSDSQGDQIDADRLSRCADLIEAQAAELATPPASVVEAMEKAMDRQVRNCPVCKGKGTAVSGYELLTYHKHGRTEPVEEPCNWCSAGRIATAALTAWRDAQ